MNKRLIVRFTTKDALDEFNRKNGFDITPLTKEYDVHTKVKVEKKKPKAKKEDLSRDWWKDSWWGLPMYESHDDEPYAKVDMLFHEDDLEYAKKIFEQNVTEKSLSLRYPKLIPGWHAQLRVIGGSSEHRYPIYVISKGRSTKCYTSRFLTQMEVKHFVVCEPSEYNDYKEHVENEYATLLQLDMSYKDTYDTCDDMDPSFPKGSGPARNFVWDDSVKRGAKWHWIMDDNAVEGFHYRWHNAKLKCRTGALIASCEDFVDRYDNIGMFGPNYSGFCHIDTYRPPFITNTRVYSCILIRNDVCDKDGTPFRWRCRFNEDTDLSLRILKAGWCTVLANWALFGKATTMKVKGGNTDSIYVDGTKLKSEMIARLHPDVARVVWKFHRWHHYVDYSVFKQELKLKPGITPIAGDNNYDMRVIETDEVETTDSKAYLESKYKNTPDYIYGTETKAMKSGTAQQSEDDDSCEEVEEQKAEETNVEKTTVVETPKSESTSAVEPQNPKEYELIIDELEQIDPRTFGRLMIEMKSKLPIPLVIVHGDEGCDDIIAKLCGGLDIQMRKLYNGGVMIGTYSGKNKLVKCQPSSKPEFVKIGKIDFE